MANRAQAWLVTGLMALGATVPYLAAPLANYRLVSLPQLQRIFWDPFRGKPGVPVWEPLATLDVPPQVSAPAQTVAEPLSSPQPEAVAPVGPLLEDPANALGSFHEALSRSAQRVVRISHFGDSPITGDLISGEARARFQKLYGDAGHGWILPGTPGSGTVTSG